MVIKKYLIKLWIYASSNLVSEIKWETDNVDDIIQEVSKSLPKGIRATIEEKC